MYDLIFVAGNGKTSRANIEALVDDYIHANPKVEFLLCNSSGLSEGQVWLKQYLEDKEISFDIAKEVSASEKDNQAVFILWGDEDTESLNALAEAQALGIPAFDLTDGLVELKGKDGISRVVAPIIPEQESIIETEEVLAEDDFDDDDREFQDPLYEAVNVIAGIFAEAIAKELKKVLKK